MSTRRVTATVALGALCGLAWAASFRAVMSEFAGFGSTVSWLDTFAAILLPGVIVGGLLGWAHTIRLSGGRRGWRWLGAAPALFAVAPMLLPGRRLGRTARFLAAHPACDCVVNTVPAGDQGSPRRRCQVCGIRPARWSSIGRPPSWRSSSEGELRPTGQAMRYPYRVRPFAALRAQCAAGCVRLPPVGVVISRLIAVRFPIVG
jgi:hypothetical protein